MPERREKIEQSGSLPNGLGSMDNLIVENILNCMSDSLIVLGKDGDVLYANKSTERILGYSEAEIREQGIGMLFFTNSLNHAFNQLFIDTIAQKRINAYREVDYYAPDGEMKRLSATTSYLISPDADDSTFVGFVALFRDITEIFKLRENEKRLLTLKQTLEKDRVDSLRKLAMGVAHELRNPLVTIGGFARRIAASEETAPRNRNHATRIVDDVVKLESLVKRIMEYCNLPAVKGRLGQLSSFIEETVDSLKMDATKKEILWQYRDSFPLNKKVFYDKTLLRMAIVNVLDNAISFSNHGSEVLVILDEYLDWARIRVVDNGPGIRKEDIPYALDPFFSALGDGPGMGLAIARRVITDHHGRIEIESEYGNGATVSILLPLSPPDRLHS